MASLELMKITGYTDKDFQLPLSGLPYTVMINPDTVKVKRAIEYNQQQAPGKSNPSQRYKATPSDKLNFEIVIDCTGIVDWKRTDMATEISSLEKIVYTFDGKIHRPNFVKVQWGKNMIFYGVLIAMDISYTLFKPDGSPLRAKLSMGFNQYMAPKTVTKVDKPTSPDITHLVTVAEGMSLPQLCQQVWQNDQYYVQVAKYNKLNKFRNLKGVGQLVFPPIIQPV